MIIRHIDLDFAFDFVVEKVFAIDVDIDCDYISLPLSDFLFFKS